MIDLSMWEAMLSTGVEGWINHALGNPPYAPMANRHPTLAPHGVYRCVGHDEWVALAAESPAQWQALCRALGPPAPAADPRLDRAVGWLLEQQDATGRWANRYPYAGKLIVDIDAPGRPSKWVTLRACRVLKAVDEARDRVRGGSVA